MAEPKRIQRRRTRGWRLPAGAICVDRSTHWGNPFNTGDAAADVASHRDWLEGCIERGTIDLAELQAELGGHDLACFCREGARCHGDTLLELANATPSAAPAVSAVKP